MNAAMQSIPQCSPHNMVVVPRAVKGSRFERALKLQASGSAAIRIGSRTSASLQILVPGQFHFVETLGSVGVEMNFAKAGAHAFVEAAGGDVYILGFDLQLGASTISGTDFGLLE